MLALSNGLSLQIRIHKLICKLNPLLNTNMGSFTLSLRLFISQHFHYMAYFGSDIFHVKEIFHVYKSAMFQLVVMKIFTFFCVSVINESLIINLRSIQNVHGLKVPGKK